MVAMAVVVAVGLILYLLSVPPYYKLKLTRTQPWERGAAIVGNNTSEDHQVQGTMMGLEYFSNWGMRHWGTNYIGVSVTFSLKSQKLVYKTLLIIFCPNKSIPFTLYSPPIC